jgi:cyclopropane-fatty-acyl-phospholipid synthase
MIVSERAEEKHPPPASILDTYARQSLFSLLGRLRRGRITISEGEAHQAFSGEKEKRDLQAFITVRHPHFYSQAVLGGSVGAGEAYMAGLWTCDDLTALLRIILLNSDVFLGLDAGLARLRSPAFKFYHFLHKGTREGSRINIAMHYDLGNDFYELLLDETMTYSCGIFERQNSSLKEASVAKYDRICRKLEPSPSDHVLEIGTGWGGFAIHAAKQYGCRITTTTISRAQYDYAKERIKSAGLADRVTLLLQDYRDLTGRFDKLVSIEMIEAVGHHYLNDFFRCCSDCLSAQGSMALQAITIADQSFDRHKKEVDFIKRFIFPGSCIPSIAAIGHAIAEATDLRLFHMEDLTPHYARTLRAWRERLFQNLDKIKALGYSDTFIRMWEFYLCYCEAGFAERYLADVQMLFIKPLCRRESLLPPLA